MFVLIPDAPDFNPRSREGSDEAKRISSTPKFISIHAPAKGATLNSYDMEVEKAISIHAPAKGATSKALVNPSQHLFQSTLPRRERLLYKGCFPVYVYFNPRSREGSDIVDGFHRYRVMLISIHATAKGATFFILHNSKHPSISIHAPAKGATKEP